MRTTCSHSGRHVLRGQQLRGWLRHVMRECGLFRDTPASTEKPQASGPTADGWKHKGHGGWGSESRCRWSSGCRKCSHTDCLLTKTFPRKDTESRGSPVEIRDSHFCRASHLHLVPPWHKWTERTWHRQGDRHGRGTWKVMALQLFLRV